MPYNTDRHILFFFVPSTVKTEEIYNPTELRTFRSEPGSDLAKLLLSKGPEVVLVESIGGGQYKIIRRTPWPASQANFETLTATGTGTGEGTEQSFFSLNSDQDEFSPGIPFGTKNGSKALLTIILIVLGFIIITDK